MHFPFILECFGKRNLKLTHPKHKTPSPPSPSEGGNFQVVEGRRFIDEEDVDYVLPNDNTEVGRLHLQHWALKLAFGRNYHAPVQKLLEEGIQVVDAGCGPATWTFEMAESYPHSHFTGLDVSSVFPESTKPSNVDFHICNISKEIPFTDNSIDYYHQRLLVAGLNDESMKAAIKNAYRVLKPGGYLEMTEALMGTALNAGTNFTNIKEILAGIMKKKGLNPDIGNLLGDYMQEAGFENIHHEKKPAPMNHSGKAGELAWEDYAELCRSFKPFIAMVNPAYQETEVFEKFIRSVEEECAETKAMVVFCVSYGQKPLK
ncbi:S-adenosyl-L-methionine-dependent methyltransferase [Pilobolus umbonatus]|nr:S-adenosyl-L-methionine-dependent methyltransferase [Pilobolus umbonatus]